MGCDSPELPHRETIELLPNCLKSTRLARSTHTHASFLTFDADLYLLFKILCRPECDDYGSKAPPVVLPAAGEAG